MSVAPAQLSGPVQRVWVPLRGVVLDHRSKFALAGVILVLGIVTATQASVFLTWGNWQNILTQVAVIGVLAVGTTLLMVSGGLDLSIGSGVSFCGIVMATLMADGWSPWLAVPLGILVAAGIGGVNGTLAAWSKSHPFILTLGMLTLLQGATLLVSNLPITDLPASFLGLSFSRPLGLPIVVLVFVVVAILAQIVLSTTQFGRWLYAIGGSESAARLAGIRVRAVKVGLYALNGVLVGVAATLLVVQLASAQPQMGIGLELAAIAAVAVGGTPLAGGRGDIVGTLLGVLLLGMIANALNLMSIPSELQYVLQGAIIVVAVMSQRGD